MKITRKCLRRLIKESADIIATGLYDNAISDRTKKIINALGGIENILNDEEVANQAASFIAAFPDSFEFNRAYFEHLKKMENLKMKGSLGVPKLNLDQASQARYDYVQSENRGEDELYAHGYLYWHDENILKIKQERERIKSTHQKRINNIQNIIDVMS